MTNTNSVQELKLQAVQPKEILSILPFDKKKCPLIISEQGNATTLYRYADAGAFVDLFDPLAKNLLPALQYSIIKGKFLIFNFGKTEQLNELPPILERLKTKCAEIHKDLYNHIINNSLTKQSFETIISLIPFEDDNKLVSQVYETSRETFRILFLVQIDPAQIKSYSNDPVLSLFDCICIKP